jgi:hypothetical protein
MNRTSGVKEMESREAEVKRLQEAHEKVMAARALLIFGPTRQGPQEFSQIRHELWMFSRKIAAELRGLGSDVKGEA